MQAFVTLEELKGMNPCGRGLRHLLKHIEWDDGYNHDCIMIPLVLIAQVSPADDLEWLLEQLNVRGMLNDCLLYQFDQLGTGSQRSMEEQKPIDVAWARKLKRTGRVIH